jgi:hypothetical protein
MQINELDQPALYRQHNAYLDDKEAMTTSAMQLQDDAYALGYQRRQSDALTLLAKVMQNHVTALPLAIRAEIEAVIG